MDMASRRWALFRKRPLHEATRRALCRLVFLFAAALPVLLTLAACVAEFLPSYQRARVAHYQQQLSSASGCKVEITSVELREPSRRLLHGLTIFHPETGELIARIETLDIYQNASGYALRWFRPSIPVDQLATAYRLVHEHVLCRPAIKNQVTVTRLDGLTLVDEAERSVRFRTLRLELKRMPAKTEATLNFAIDGVAGQPATLAFERHHDQSVPVTHLTLNTGGQRVPGHWVTRFAPELAVSGAGSAFTGRYELHYDLSQWKLHGSGQLLDLDAATWMERPLLSGFANLTLSQLAMNDEGLTSAVGQLSIRDGRLHDDLITAATYVGIVNALGEPKNIAHSFTHLALEFSLNSKGLHLKSGLPGLPEGTVAADTLGPLAHQQWTELVPMNNVWTSLAMTTLPQATDNLFESPTARRLVQWLPKATISPPDVPTNYQARTE